tara:strand:- start:303 stop:590 length:288 start_codon:yes stop_codon:yes gene_type:complete
MEHQMPSEPVVIPGWAIKVSSAFGVLAVPWAAWVTMQLATMSVKLDISQAMKKDVERASSNIELIIDRMRTDDIREVRDTDSLIDHEKRISALER